MNTVEYIKQLQKLNFETTLKLSDMLREVCPHDDIAEDATIDDDGFVEASRYCKVCYTTMPEVRDEAR